MLDQCELVFGRYNGGANAPIGSYFCPRTGAIFQQLVDGVLPQAGTWCPVTNSGSSTLAQCASAINAGLNRGDFTAASLHTYTVADNVPVPGQMTNDG